MLQRDLWGRPFWGPRGAPPRAPSPVVRSASPRVAPPPIETLDAPPPSAVRATAPVNLPPPADDPRIELRRAADELAAAKGRVEREARRAEEATRVRLVAELIPVLDNLDRTVAAGSSDTALLEGVGLIRAQLEGVLVRHGLERIDAVGARFDPSLHEAIAVEPVDDPSLDGVVTAAIARGYRLGSRALVPARVRVGKLRQTP